MSGQEVRREESDGVLVLTIYRPQARNAVDRATSEQLAAGLDELDHRDELHVGVLTGGAARSAPAWTSRRSPGARRPRSRVAASRGSPRRSPASRSSPLSRATRSPAA